MAIETEIKYRLSAGQAEEIENRLDGLGAERGSSQFEENSIFRSPHLEESGAAVRIRRTPNKALLTFKRRMSNEDEVKRQLEFETVVEEPETIEAILLELGLERQLVYEKFRRTWNWQTIEVVLDRLPFGEYMEIEGPIDEIKKCEALLFTDGTPEVEHSTYPELTRIHGMQLDATIESRFEKSTDFTDSN